MKIRRAPWPRRKKALVWSLAAAALLVVLMAGHFLCFTPGQALRAAEFHAATGRTQVVLERSVGNLPLYFSQNDQVLMVTPFHPSLRYDWRNNGHPLLVVDCTRDPEGVRAGGLHVWDPESQDSHLLLFGWVDLPGAASVVAHYTGTATSSSYDSPELTAAIVQAGAEKGLFWTEVTLPGDAIHLTPDQLLVLDQTGRTLCTYDLTGHWGYASYPLSETR